VTFLHFGVFTSCKFHRGLCLVAVVTDVESFMDLGSNDPFFYLKNRSIYISTTVYNKIIFFAINNIIDHYNRNATTTNFFKNI